MAIAPRIDRPLPYQRSPKRSSPSLQDIFTPKGVTLSVPFDSLVFTLLRIVPLALALIFLAFAHSRVIVERKSHSNLQKSRTKELDLRTQNIQAKDLAYSEDNIKKWALAHGFEKTAKSAYVVHGSHSLIIAKGN